MGKPGAVEAGLFEAVGRLASAFLQYAAEFGESERMKAEETIVHQLVNIQSLNSATVTNRLLFSRHAMVWLNRFNIIAFTPLLRVEMIEIAHCRQHKMADRWISQRH